MIEAFLASYWYDVNLAALNPAGGGRMTLYSLNIAVQM
jgi:hypothetical protein